MNTIARVLLSLSMLLASTLCSAEEEMFDNPAAKQQALLVVERWQLAYQNKDLKELAALYADQVDYFHKMVTREAVMANKAAFFNAEKKKFLSQAIVSTITVNVDGNDTDDGGLDDRLRAEFVKQVNVAGQTQNYPASLYIKPNAAGKWQIIAESDGITDANLGFDDDSRQVVRGKFDGLQRQYAWVDSRNAKTGGDCNNGDNCHCYLWTSNAEVKPTIIPQCINASLAVVPGLDSSGRDRLQLIDQRWQGSWLAIHLYDIQYAQWTPAIPSVSSNVSAIEQFTGALVSPEPAKPGFVRITETTSDPDTGEFINKTLVLPLNNLPGYETNVVVATDRCLNYEQPVSFSGIVEISVFFGPPNFGEEPETDSRNIQGLLFLDKPICTVGDDINEAEKEQIEVTLIPTDSVNLADFAGRHVTVSGSLSHGFNGHHNTALLLDLSDVPKITAKTKTQQ